MTTMGVYIEVYPVSVDPDGIWRIAGAVEPWTTAEPLPAGENLHHAALRVLRDGGLPDPKLLHSTSWHQEPRGMVLTYLSVHQRTGDWVIDDWPHARPVTLTGVRRVGRPDRHGAAEEPNPRAIDVLKHALRHLWWLVNKDEQIRVDLTRAGMADELTRWLQDLEPELAYMYESDEAA